MAFLYDHDASGQSPVVEESRIYGSDGSTATVAGQAMQKGTTPGTDAGSAVPLSGTGQDFLGVAEAAHSSFGAVSTGTLFNEANYVLLTTNFDAYYKGFYDRDSAIAVTSSSTTTVTITSWEDNIDGSTAYNITDNEIAFAVASASGSFTTATTTGWTSADSVIKILPENHLFGVIDTLANSLNTTAAVGTLEIRVKANYVVINGHTERLDFSKHDNTTYDEHPEFYSTILFRDHINLQEIS